MTREPDGERIARLEQQVIGLERLLTTLENRVWLAMSAAVGSLAAGLWQILPYLIRGLK